MKEPILTIGIPTYNRPNSIVKTVRALLPQLNDLVVLKVWDNCSDTPVSTLFTDEEKEKFTIIRNKTNIGGDANICGVIYNADTKWVWDLGDDDEPLENAVEVILNYIGKYPEALFFKYNSYIERELHSFNDVVDICKYQWVFSNFLYISSGIYNREKLNGDIQHYYVNLSSMVGQTIFILKHLEKKDEECYFLSKKIVGHSVDGLEEGTEEIEGGTWDAATFINRSSIIFDVFKDKKKALNSTLFAGVANQYLNSLGGHGLSMAKTLSSLKKTIENVGLINILRFNHSAFGKLLVKLLLLMILPDKYYQKIKKKKRLNANRKTLEKEICKFKNDSLKNIKSNN